jgi:MFS family permease
MRNGARWFYSYLPHGMAGGATSALIPLFAHLLGGGLAEVGIIAAATSIASVPALVLWGVLSDRTGRRKPFLLLGFLGSSVSFAAMAVSGGLPAFYLANLLFGAIGSASAPVGAVLVMETSEQKRWPSRLASLSRIGGIGWVSGLSLGVAWLSLAGPALGEVGAMRALFAIGAVLSAVAAVVASAWLREPDVKVERRDVALVDFHLRIERVKFLPMRLLYFIDPRAHPDRPTRLSRPLRVYLGSVFLLFTGFTAFYAFFPVFLKEAYGFASPDIFLVYMASQVASALAYGSVAPWIAARGSRAMQAYASVGRAALFPSFLALAVLPLPALVRFPLALLLHAGVGLCWAVLNVAGNTLVSRLAPERGRAEALGAFNAMQGIGSIVGPLVGGFVAQVQGYPAAFGFSVAFVLIGAAILRLDLESARSAS